METKENLSESISIHKVRVRKKENGRMKLHINLTKEEGEAFTNFMSAVNVQNLSEQDFTKAAFVIGLQAMEQSVQDALTAYLQVPDLWSEEALKTQNRA